MNKLQFQTDYRDFVLDCLRMMEDSYREALSDPGPGRFAALIDASGAGRAIIARLRKEADEKEVSDFHGLFLFAIFDGANLTDEFTIRLLASTGYEENVARIMLDLQSAKEFVVQIQGQQVAI